MMRTSSAQNRGDKSNVHGASYVHACAGRRVLVDVAERPRRGTLSSPVSAQSQNSQRR